MGCCFSKHDDQSEVPIRQEPRPQLNEPHYDNPGQAGAGNLSPPTPSPNKPAPHEIGVAVTTPDDTAAPQQDDNFLPGPSTAPQAPVMLAEAAADRENSRRENVKSRSSSSSSSSSSSNRRNSRGERAEEEARA